jgi:acyl-CoA thioester hydrolase
MAKKEQQRPHPLLAGFSVVIEVPIAWGEMDSFGHVNNIVYFRWFESARIAYFDRIGFRAAEDNGNVGPILASTHCRFRKPLEYPDTVLVGARVTDIAPDRFTMEYRLVSKRLDLLAAEGGGVVVAFDYTRSEKAPLPDRVRNAITQLDSL